MRRGIGSSDIVRLPWYRRVFWVLERPFVLVRNATIPPVEADSWSQTQAAVSNVVSGLFGCASVVTSAAVVVAAMSGWCRCCCCCCCGG